MRSTVPRPSSAIFTRSGARAGAVGLALVVGTISVAALGSQSAGAVATTVDLGLASPYSVLAGQEVTNTGSSVLSGSLGVSPGKPAGPRISGFPPGLVTAPAEVHDIDAQAASAQDALVTAYQAATAQASDGAIDGDIGNTIVGPGVYTAASSIGITGPLTLDGGGDPDAVFVFQIGSALTTATASSVVPVNGTRACNVFWQVGSSATLGTGTSFTGTIMALTSISTQAGTTIAGRALARNGSVTLIDTVFTGPGCTTPVPPSTTPPTIPPPTGGPSSPPPSSPPATTAPPSTPPTTPSTSTPPVAPPGTGTPGDGGVGGVGGAGGSGGGTGGSGNGGTGNGGGSGSGSTGSGSSSSGGSGSSSTGNGGGTGSGSGTTGTTGATGDLASTGAGALPFAVGLGGIAALTLGTILAIAMVRRRRAA
jgi:hypothetical protein